MPSPASEGRPLPRGYGGARGFEHRIEALLAGGGCVQAIGRSYEGRALQAYQWESTPAAPRLLLLSLLHPMEWIGLETHLALLGTLLDPAAGGPGPANPRLRPSVASVPIANPDGFHRVEADLRAGRFRWRRGNIARVDLNRNFPVDHRARTGLRAAWPLHRPGPSPLSEPETRAIAQFARSFRPTIAISLHSFGRWIFVPPAGRWRRAPASDTLLRRAREASGLAHYRSAVLGRWSPFFRAHGTELDFLHEELGAASYLVELSGGGFSRWGATCLLSPFHLFNPPCPEREITRVLPALLRLASS